jgi:hypothetical protein
MRFPTYRSVDHIGCHPKPHSVVIYKPVKSVVNWYAAQPVVNYKPIKSVVNWYAAQPVVNCKAAQSLVNCLSTDMQGCIPTGSLVGSGPGIVSVVDVVQASQLNPNVFLRGPSPPARHIQSFRLYFSIK